MTKLEKFKKICRDFLVVNDTSYFDVIFGCIFANRLDSQPVWLFIVGPPASGKSALLQPLSGHPEIYPLSKMTTNSLVSAWTSKDKKDASLLPLLDGKVLIMKDFTAMLSMRSQDLHEILGQLRDAYDGTVRNKYGIGDAKYYKSKFGCIAAVTVTIDKQRPMMTELGERFITYRLPPVTDCEIYRRGMKIIERKSYTEVEQKLKKAAHEVLDLETRPAVLGTQMGRMILNMAQFVAIARCEISRDRFTKEPEIPQPEVPTRLVKQLTDLAIGIAMAREKDEVTIEEVRLVQQVAIDSLTQKRIVLLKTIMHAYPDYTTVKKVAEIMNFPEGTIRTHIEDLKLLGLVEMKIVYSPKMTEIHQYRIKKDKLLASLFTDRQI